MCTVQSMAPPWTDLQLAGGAKGGALVDLSLQGRADLVVGVAHNGGAPGADCRQRWEQGRVSWLRGSMRAVLLLQAARALRGAKG